jgi:proline iminopeptidase
MLPFRRLADRFTLVFYDHRGNGRSQGAPVSSMTWENLTADADALRQRLGFDRWAVLDHSFGGQVALEYALRYPDRLSHLVLLDTCGASRWVQEHVPELLAKRGYSKAHAERPAEVAEAVSDFLSAETAVLGASPSFVEALRSKT